MSNDLTTALDRDLQAARKPMHARRDAIEAEYVAALNETGGELREVLKISDRKQGALRALAKEFAPVFAAIIDFHGGKA